MFISYKTKGVNAMFYKTKGINPMHVTIFLAIIKKIEFSYNANP